MPHGGDHVDLLFGEDPPHLVPDFGEAWQEKGVPSTRGIVCQPPADRVGAPEDAVWMLRSNAGMENGFLTTYWMLVWIPREEFLEKYVFCPIRVRWTAVKEPSDG